MKIYHNPRCRKSRETLSILIKKNVKFEVIEYLKNPLTKSEIKNILSTLNISAKDLIRKEDKFFKENFKESDLTDDQCLDLLYKHPILMQRPIVVKNQSAVLGRPPINVLDLLSN
ncbi:MAG: arsenate reductase (glutaredoxin) [Flavobacteriales bacterium]|nr:arsenate reductase (glutaredoxin) [Flavobacteriales bacterium]|tara:strand:+ start:294 stop:638 length:345 start_codon:yes stop_codon:yes gene_type:complete